MIYGYIRISTDKQNTENQRFEILKFANEKKMAIDSWVEETISSRKKLEHRKLSELLNSIKEGDVIIMTELSRLGRSLMEVMSILHDLMNKKAKVFTTKERYELGNNINSQILAFAFGLSAQIERDMISMRTKEALDRCRSEGKKLGRPKGSFSTTTKLTEHKATIAELLSKQVPIASIARILGVSRGTVSHYVSTRKLKKNIDPL
jgi:DNA invertase Pin-like site-specific DNA recombinase